MQVLTWPFSCQQNLQLSSSCLPTLVLKVVTLLAIKHVQQRKFKEKYGGREAGNEVDEEEEKGEEEKDGDEDEEAEAATSKWAAEDDEDEDVNTKKQNTDEDD